MISDAEDDADSRSHSADESGSQENAEMTEAQGSEANKNGALEKRSSNAKDLSRPRRKKARRACFACQRAHLTCGDERPCQRCIKRGLSEQCADGVRKKAKYLHDAPSDALLPGGSSHYQYIDELHQAAPATQSPSFAVGTSVDLYGQSAEQTSGLPLYSPNTNPPHLSEAIVHTQSYGAQMSPVMNHYSPSTGHPPSSMQSLVEAMQQAAPTNSSNPIQETFVGNPFDASDLSQYNFDPASFNFGNHYGALEFGMLGHMATGAADSPASDSLNQSNHHSYARPGSISTTYAESPLNPQSYLFGQDSNLNDWQSSTQTDLRQKNGSGGFHPASQNHALSDSTHKQEVSPAFPIGLPSTFENSTIEGNYHKTMTVEGNPSGNLGLGTREGVVHQVPGGSRPYSSPSALRKRPRDPSSIYASVTQPFNYTLGFHALIAFVKKRFSSEKTVRIAKSLASIRPSFISCTKTLGRDDLIFMEKCFQRSLWEYEDFIAACGTPTIVCRRTGEVAAVGKEFSILTGWRKDVLLGKEANLNINTGGSSGQPSTGTSSRGGVNTPRLPEGTLDASRPQAVFLAELLDDDSVITFYEDFARLAFGDSRGGVVRNCKLLKYRTKDLDPTADDSRGRMTRRKNGDGRIEDLGKENGKVECSCCWTIKRDLFDLPMMIVMNFLPCI